MSFRDNLQHLRSTRNMTQEQLAMLVGVSRQSVTKWESERAYPEMDKLIKICQIFDCSLDDLVSGDLTTREPEPTQAPVPALADVCGYDEHKRKMALRISMGVGIISGSSTKVRCSRMVLAPFRADITCSPFWRTLVSSWSTKPGLSASKRGRLAWMPCMR